MRAKAPSQEGGHVAAVGETQDKATARANVWSAADPHSI